MNSQKVTLRHAHKAGAIFRRHPFVQEVELFGSVAREGSGNDLDFILIVPDETARAFERRATEEILGELAISEALAVIEEWAPVRPPPQRGPREQVAIELLGEDFMLLMEEAYACLPEPSREQRRIDLFMLPFSWRTRLFEPEEGFSPKDIQFWHRVARDAKPLTEETS